MTYRYLSAEARTVDLGEPIARGAEGAIHPLLHSPHLLAKIYPPAGSLGKKMLRHGRLRAMLAQSPWPAGMQISWPQEILYSGYGLNSECVGFIMARLSGVTLDTLTIPRLLLARVPGLRDGAQLRLYLYRVLWKLATAFAEVEGRGLLPGDISAANVLFDPPTGEVALIDCDSFQIPSGPGCFLPGAATQEYLPPELIDEVEAVVRTKEHFRFSAAVLFFLVLLHGWHPYQCLGAGTPVENIRDGRTAMGASHGLARGYYPGPIYRLYRSLHPAVLRCFIDTLVRGHRHPELRVDFRTWQRAFHRAIQSAQS